MVAAVCGTGDSGVAMVQRTGLRPSPAVHHPDPNPHALRTFAEGRYDELHPPYDRPGTRLFQEFCDTVVQRWQLRSKVYSRGWWRSQWVITRASFRQNLSIASSNPSRNSNQRISPCPRAAGYEHTASDSPMSTEAVSINSPE